VSTIYLAIAARPEGTGAAVFKRSAGAIAADRALTLALSRGELLRAGYVPNPCGRRTDIGASLAQALAVCEWFRSGLSVGGAGVPEEFIASRESVANHPALISALMMAWALDDPEAVIADAKRTERGPDWLHVGSDPAPGEKSLLDSGILLAGEEAVVRSNPAPLALEAIVVGLLHLGRWNIGHAARVPMSAGSSE
jgi:hypothetical protein